jgi:tRNA(Arg) A34 adenosine deaminase TadA
MKKITTKRLIFSIALFISGMLFVLILQGILLFSDRIRPKVEVPKEVKDSLIVLMKKAKEMGETPVAAIITFDDSILASAYNTVKADSDFTRHAEINAISCLINKYGHEKFNELDRKKLILYSTYEPCLMCKGAIMHTKIMKIVSLYKKPIKENYFFENNNWSYYFNRKTGKLTEEEEQQCEKIIFTD